MRTVWPSLRSSPGGVKVVTVQEQSLKNEPGTLLAPHSLLGVLISWGGGGGGGGQTISQKQAGRRRVW